MLPRVVPFRNTGERVMQYDLLRAKQTRACATIISRGATSNDVGEIGEPEVGVRVQLRPGPLHAVLDVGSSRLGGQAAGRQRPTAGQQRTTTTTAALHAPAQDRWY